MISVDKGVISLSWKNWQNDDGTTRFTIEATISSTEQDGKTKLYEHIPVYAVRTEQAGVRALLESVEKITGSSYGVFDFSGLFSIRKTKDAQRPIIILRSLSLRKNTGK